MDTELNYLELVTKDIRFTDCYKTCMNCGICSAICPAAHVYDYKPRELYSIIQRGSNSEIKTMLSSDIIWECGQCLSCKPRCPRNNIPGVLVQILRKVSQQTGLYKQSTKGIAQKEIVRSIGKNIYATGYCISPDALIPSDHPELGPVWEWTYENREDLYPRLGSPYKKETIGSVRAIPSKTITELQMIFELTNGTDFLNTIMEGESWQ